MEVLGASGSLDASHEYVDGGRRIETHTVNFESLLEHAGCTECDVLKLDVEGAEYKLIDSLITSGGIRAARQLLIEFHHRVTHHTFEDTQRSVNSLVTSGFRLVHTEGRNYVFCREGF